MRTRIYLGTIIIDDIVLAAVTLKKKVTGSGLGTRLYLLYMYTIAVHMHIYRRHALQLMYRFSRSTRDKLHSGRALGFVSLVPRFSPMRDHLSKEEN